MSLLQEVIEQYCQTEASSETPRPLSDKSAKRGSGTYGTESPGRSHISKGLVVSVDQWSKKLQECPDELRRAASDDWEEVSADIVGFADALAVHQIRESGEIPDHYASETECKHCGLVPIWPGCPSQVHGCPWCFNRIKGLPIPGVKE